MKKFVIGLICSLAIGLILMAVWGSGARFAFATSLAENPVMIEARQTQLSPGSVAGVTHRLGEHAADRADTEIDFSRPEIGVFCVRYTGKANAFQIWVEKTQSGQRAIYPCPADGSWACLPLPFGAGEYTVTTNPYSTADNLSQGEDRSIFTLTATYEDETEPFRYANLFSDYDENSLEVRVARVIEKDEREALGRAPTDLELTDAIISFVFKNIIGEGTIGERRKGPEDFYYFPDNATTLAEGRGSCADKASVAAAMLKSLGIPVRIDYGYIEKTGLYQTTRIYHAWLNVWLDGAWTMYDPSYSQDEINENATDGNITYLFDTVTVQ